MKKGKYRFVERDIPLYFGVLRIIIADDLQAANDALELGDTAIQGGLGCYQAVVWDVLVPGEQHTIYAMFRGRPDAQTLAHEAKHVVNRLFRARGVVLDLWHDEPECYMIGWVAKWIDFCANSKEVKSKKYPKQKLKIN